jgi:hypothetical protein
MSISPSSLEMGYCRLIEDYQAKALPPEQIAALDFLLSWYRGEFGNLAQFPLARLRDERLAAKIHDHFSKEPKVLVPPLIEAGIAMGIIESNAYLSISQVGLGFLLYV